MLGSIGIVVLPSPSLHSQSRKLSPERQRQMMQGSVESQAGAQGS